MPSWLTIALLLIIIGLIFGVGIFVEAGKIILIVILVLLLIAVLAGMAVQNRRA
jgi:cbb3-type cytochrome oxidase subunit 3